MLSMIYLDANATSPVLPAASAAAHAALSANFGNPSSTHAVGLRARAMLDATRACARRVLGAPTGRLLFNSGATEGIQTAVLSCLVALKQKGVSGGLLLYGATEHKAVPQAMAHWNAILGTGCEVRALPVDANGQHRLDLLAEWAPHAHLVCTMAANNETGVISNLADISRLLENSPALWLVDCVQALGKLALDLSASRIDYAPFSGHKLYAPKGIGMLYVRDGAPFTPLIAGGGQEEGQRSGTENMAGIAALGAVLAALEEGGTFHGHATLERYRERLAQALVTALPGLVFNMPFAHSLPTTINFSVLGRPGSDIVELFDAAGIQVSAGSACSSAKTAPSYVLEAMALPHWRAASAVRLSFGPAVDDAFIDAACARIAHCGAALVTPRMATGAALGAMRLATGGWLLFHEASRACALVDAPQAPLALIAAEGYTLQAVLDVDSVEPITLGAHHIARGADGRYAYAGMTFDDAPAVDMRPAPVLEHAQLADFFAAHPDARLVDVREAFEHAAGAASLAGRAPESNPLSRHAESIPAWLAEQGHALVFVCRSGGRSARAAATLRHLGRQRVYHLVGGFALASDPQT
ncbi:MAG: aminotransferase class V-fold PLP-dependent enzyme [Pseudomonadota bacterium]|nr:aminotransferase class V-fold PLP-dependent enzyme [Pseudomonadota bacterium]